MHFQHPESRKNHTFRFFSNFSRHGSCGYATKLQKQHKIRIWPWSVHCATQLRVPADRTALSLNCFFRTNARNWMSVHEVRPWGQQKSSENSILASKLTSMSTTRWYFMNGQRKFTTLKFSDSIWNSAQFIRTRSRGPYRFVFELLFSNKCAKLDVRSWSKTVRTTEIIRKFNFSIKTYINEHYKVVLHERTTQVHYFKIFRFHMKFSSVHP